METKNVDKTYYSKTKQSLTYYYNNREHVLVRMKEYRENYKDYFSLYNKLYYLNNKKGINKRHQINHRTRKMPSKNTYTYDDTLTIAF